MIMKSFNHNLYYTNHSCLPILADFGYPVWALSLSRFQRLLKCENFQSFDFEFTWWRLLQSFDLELTWWRLLQKPTKFDIYVFMIKYAIRCICLIFNGYATKGKTWIIDTISIRKSDTVHSNQKRYRNIKTTTEQTVDPDTKTITQQTQM